MNTRWTGRFAPRWAGVWMVAWLALALALPAMNSGAQDYGLRKADIAIEGMT